MQFEAVIHRLQLLLVVLPLNLPVAIPDTAIGLTDSCQPWSGSAGSLRVVELAAVQIAQGQVRQVEIAHVPGFRFCDAAVDALPEERELESEAVAIRRLHVTRVVPPFRLEVWMVEVVAWKFVTIAGQSRAVLRNRRRLQREQRNAEAREPTLHAPPRSGSTARPRLPDTDPRVPSPRKRPSTPRESPRQASENEWSSRKTAC